MEKKGDKKPSVNLKIGKSAKKEKNAFVES
jgi:hypothetical protein